LKMSKDFKVKFSKFKEKIKLKLIIKSTLTKKEMMTTQFLQIN
jgi:hypothetical protein